MKEFVIRQKIALLAVAAVVLAIAGGVGFGMLSGGDKPQAKQPTAPIERPNSNNIPVTTQTTDQVVQPVEPTSAPFDTIPASGDGGSDHKAPPPSKPKRDLHKEALRALGQ